jgi:hypothetical protein
MGRIYDTISNHKSLHTLFGTGAVHNYVTKKAARELSISRLPEPFRVGIGIGGERRDIHEACLVYGEL